MDERPQIVAPFATITPEVANAVLGCAIGSAIGSQRSFGGTDTLRVTIDADFLLAALTEVASGTPVLRKWLLSGGFIGGSLPVVSTPSKVVYSWPGWLETTSEAAIATEVWHRSGKRFASNCPLLRSAGAVLACISDPATGEPHALAAQMCKRTHADPRAVIACDLLTHCILSIVAGCPDKEYTPAEIATGPEEQPTAQVMEAYHRGLMHSAQSDLAGLKLNEFGKESHILTAVKAIGAVMHALQFAASRGKKLRLVDYCRSLAAQGGDADTNCAIAGMLIGLTLNEPPTLPGVENFDHIESWVKAVTGG